MRHADAGLTLIELLVTLALTGLLTAVLAQALTQVRRVEILLETGQLSAQTRALRREWLRVALECALPVPSGPDEPADEQFDGSAHRLTLLTTQAPGSGGSGLARLQVTLRHDARTGSTKLEARRFGAAAEQSWLVDEWPGYAGRISYLDAEGQWRDQWSAGNAPAPALPRAIRIDPGVPDAALLLVHLSVSPHALPRRRDLAGY
ncbi:MAG: prepilin-type N-terminal cleavage/methylation domain-containing protein [Rubrivivax sp.]|nr:prepilin-type N-terminal cleavage/methylation domain-containing protein [Rubrivivax sp.]